MIINQINWEVEIDKFKEDYLKYNFYNGPNADKFFVYFRKKYILNLKISPWDEIKIYKELLGRIKEKYKEEYKRIHKGTPFFWIGWNSFLLEYYDQAIFYIDAAMSEDKQNHPPEIWPDSGAALFFKLKLGVYRKFFRSSNAPELKDILEEELTIFNSINSNNLGIDNFINLFVEKLIYDENTAIITALYSFIFEKEDIIEMIEFRGKNGGTIEPMILHLFKGAVIFETLIKKHYIEEGTTLGDILSSTQIKNNFGYNYQNCRASSLEEIFEYLETNNLDCTETAFHVTCKIRNTTAHNLIWNDKFTVDNYNLLYRKILHAIFYVIQKEYI